MAKVEILGVKIDNLSPQEVLEKSSQFLKSKNQYFIVTPNPEFLVSAKKDKNFQEILNYADIAIADGVGLIYAAKFLGQQLQRVTGVDLMWYLCELAEQQNYPVYLLGSVEEITEATAEVLKENFPQLDIVGSSGGGEITPDGFQKNNDGLMEKIKAAKPKIIFVAFGAGKQEKWIFNHLDQLPSVKLAMGVGGTFDFISGATPRAPEIMRNLGLEWLYRLIKEPRRLKRIFRAVIIFPLLVLKDKIIKPKS